MAGASSITPDRLRRLRAAAQLLHRPASAGSPAEIARACAGVQSQDNPAGRLSFRSRSRKLVAADIDRARAEERSLLRTWVMRMTVHLIPTEDAGWMLPLFEPWIDSWSQRRLEQLGMPVRAQQRALRLVAKLLESEGPLTRPEMAAHLEARGIALDPMTRGHIAGRAINSGIAIMGPDRKGKGCLVLRADWLPEQPPVDREVALAELARRYLAAFGPASDRDMAAWSGLGLRNVRAGLAAIGSELTEHRFGDQVLLSLAGGLPRLPAKGRLRMLGAFDTYLLGYKGRELAVPKGRLGAINEGGGGMIHAAIVRDGLVTGTWRARRPGGSLEISIEPFAKLDSDTRAALDAEVADIARFEQIEPSVRYVPSRAA